MNGDTSTRKRTTSASASPSPSPSTTAAHLPPPRKSEPLRKVSPPLSNTRLSRLIYLLVILTTLLGAFYSYRVVQYKTEVGGWWNLALGRKPPQMQSQGAGIQFGSEKGGERRSSGEDSVEDKINALAKALGMPSKELASAIAVAVKQYVPPASLSSVAAKETGTAVEALVSGASEEFVSVASNAASTAGEEATGVMGGVVSGMESFVGMDEP